MSSNVDRAADALFPSDKSVQTGNVKFFLGTLRPVTGEHLMDQLNRADAQVRTGVAKRSRTLDGTLEVRKI